MYSQRANSYSAMSSPHEYNVPRRLHTLPSPTIAESLQRLRRLSAALPMCLASSDVEKCWNSQTQTTNGWTIAQSLERLRRSSSDHAPPSPVSPCGICPCGECQTRSPAGNASFSESDSQFAAPFVWSPQSAPRAADVGCLSPMSSRGSLTSSVGEPFEEAPVACCWPPAAAAEDPPVSNAMRSQSPECLLSEVTDDQSIARRPSTALLGDGSPFSREMSEIGSIGMDDTFEKQTSSCSDCLSASMPSTTSGAPDPTSSCAHPRPWRRLRSKKHNVYFACCVCSYRWSIPARSPSQTSGSQAPNHDDEAESEHSA